MMTSLCTSKPLGTTGKLAKYAKLPLALFLFTAASYSNADEAEVIWLGEQGIVASIEGEQLRLYGSIESSDSYTLVELTGFERQAAGAPVPDETGGGTGDSVVIRPNWGTAEVLFQCHQADVVIYQLVGGEAVEVLATTVPTDRC